jgi:prepilin-type N-terminal cleavage/methylation domain-containing protein
MVKRKGAAGFTLMELLTVVSILGVLAAVAIPAYTSYMRKSKSSEVSANLNSLFKSAATYYSMERSSMGVNSGSSSNCIVDDAGPRPLDPAAAKQAFIADSAFQALGFSIADQVYYSYGLSSSYTAQNCGTSANSVIYTLYANGDLDSDNVLSSFEMVVASTLNNQLYHGVGFYVTNESE